MAFGTTILLATQEENFAKEFGTVLSSKRSTSLKGVCKNVMELQASLEHNPVSIAVVDIDHNLEGTLKEIDRLVPLYPETRFAVVSNKSSKELILEAMQSGARYFMHKKFIEPELDRVLEKILLEGSVSATEIGSIITVFSAGGGCGATIIAINIANELRIQSEEPVLMIDMDQYYGAIANYLDISGKYGIAEVLEHEGPIDKNLIATSATEYKDNFDFLGTRPHLDDTNFKSFNEERLRQALEACKHGYKYIVVDAPRGAKQVSEVLASMSNLILVVFQTTVKDIKTAKLLIEELKRIGIKLQKIVPVANRFRRRGPTVPLEETKKVLGQETLQRIRNDFKNVTNSINVADLLSECAPRSGIRKDFQHLASKISNYKGNGDIIR